MSEMLKVEEIFGSKVFGLGTMRQRLPIEAYTEVTTVMEKGG